MSTPAIRTIQFGPFVAPCDQGPADDRGWFERHVGRNHRIRPPIGGEAASLEGGPPGWRAVVVVKQLEPGARIRAPCWLTRRPLNCEATAAEPFSRATEPEGLLIEKIEACVREGVL